MSAYWKQLPIYTRWTTWRYGSFLKFDKLLFIRQCVLLFYIVYEYIEIRFRECFILEMKLLFSDLE